MNIAIISVTEKGRRLSEHLSELLNGEHNVKRYCSEKNSDKTSEGFSDIYQLTAEIFRLNEALIFVCACGIAVRSIAPHIVSKTSDPAVIVVDDCGKYAIPILSGHLGGANPIAELIAEKIGAIAVITTATDIGGKFSPDSFARANGLIIKDMNAAKEIAAAVLNGERIGLYSDYPCANIPAEILRSEKGRIGMRISADLREKPFDITLNLVPRNIIVGIGCKRGAACDIIEKHISECLKKSGTDAVRLCAAATIDIKSEEAGLLEYCRKKHLKLYTYTARELMGVEGSFSKSDFVMKATGTDNVCERSVVRCGGRIILPKTSGNGVTAAIGELPTELDFERKGL